MFAQQPWNTHISSHSLTSYHKSSLCSWYQYTQDWPSHICSSSIFGGQANGSRWCRIAASRPYWSVHSAAWHSTKNTKQKGYLGVGTTLKFRAFCIVAFPWKLRMLHCESPHRQPGQLHHSQLSRWPDHTHYLEEVELRLQRFLVYYTCVLIHCAEMRFSKGETLSKMELAPRSKAYLITESTKLKNQLESSKCSPQ